MNYTYTAIGKRHGLTGTKLHRYVSYMNKRWADSEDVKCRVGYAGEWAERFKRGIEYSSSDPAGQAILREMDSLKDY